MKSIFSAIIILTVLAQACQQSKEIFIGQGLMSGEATENSIILQSRLTMADTLVEGDVPGAEGIGRFELAEDEAFSQSEFSPWIAADSLSDFILKYQFVDLTPATSYFYRLHFGISEHDTKMSETATFRTNAGGDIEDESSIVVVTGMNYYHFHYGKYNRNQAYKGADKHLGYPALVSILKVEPDYFIGTGDNVYFDHPNEGNFQSNVERGNDPHPGGYGGKEVIDEAGMRRKYHEQFRQPRYVDLFRQVATYWEKDDHDYRRNDSDPYDEFPISHELGIKNFKEQVPVVASAGEKTYRTRRINKDLQLWFVEGRDYRDANGKEDGPGKTLWGAEQLQWLKSSLLASDATFKLLVSPTPMVGPDDASKRDNHVNPKGFRHEGEAFFDWLVANGFLDKNFYIVCGDRHWQYHATHPKGLEEFSCGALVDNNSRAGRVAGDPKSTDPDGEIVQHYVQGTAEQATGGFLNIVNVIGEHPELHFKFYDEQGNLNYSTIKKAM